jgi:hypothetical protein
MKSVSIIVIGMTLLSPACAGDLKLMTYGLTVNVDKDIDFSRIKTYAWAPGWSAYDDNVDREIVAAMERHLAILGLTKVDEGTCDVLVSYEALRRSDVDLKSTTSDPLTHARIERPVGTLAIFVQEPGTGRQLFRARVDIPLESDPTRLQAQVARWVAVAFEQYPKESEGP